MLTEKWELKIPSLSPYSPKNSVEKPTTQQKNSMEEIRLRIGGSPVNLKSPSRFAPSKIKAVCRAPTIKDTLRIKGTAAKSPVNAFENERDIRRFLKIPEEIIFSGAKGNIVFKILRLYRSDYGQGNVLDLELKSLKYAEENVLPANSLSLQPPISLRKKPSVNSRLTLLLIKDFSSVLKITPPLISHTFLSSNKADLLHLVTARLIISTNTAKSVE